MPVLYQPFQSSLKDKNGKQLFHPRVVRTGTVNISQIAKEISAYSSLSPGDVKNTVENLVTVMTQHLQSSESVTLDGFGTFRMVIHPMKYPQRKLPSPFASNRHLPAIRIVAWLLAHW